MSPAPEPVRGLSTAIECGLKSVLAILTLTFLFPLGAPAATGEPVVVRYLKQEIPLGSAAEMWRKIAPVRIPLKAQTLSLPFGGGSIKDVAVRAVHNGTIVAFLLEWADPTLDATVEERTFFSDAAALMFPLDHENPPQPLMGHRYMGEKSAVVNIWQFKADRNSGGVNPV